jgi:sugar transferase (PEP-CTERM/EpsH1 system associated)
MKVEILFLCHRLPYPPNKGDKIRSHGLLAHLARRHVVHVGCFVDDPADMAHTDTVRSLAGGECLFVPLQPGMKWFRGGKALLTGEPITTACFGGPKIGKWVKSLVRSRPIGQAVVFSSAMAPYVLGESGLDPARALLDLVDIDSDKWRQYSSASPGPMGWIYRREANLLLRTERTAARAFGATVLSSPYETASFAELAPETTTRLHTFSNGVDLQRFSPAMLANPFPAGEQAIVMTGRFDYRPNADGAAWFASTVMPLLANHLPGARFHIVGAKPPRSLRALAGPKTVLTGEVDDVRPYIQHAAAIVAPLRMARGVQNKVLEAMAMEKPVVATWEATRALSVTSGDHLWIENDPARFAAAVLAACNGADRMRVARNGRKYVEKHHDWRQNLAVIDDLLGRLAGNSEPGEEDSGVRARHGSRADPHLGAKQISAVGAER